MKILIIGKGGREHALADAVHRSKHVTSIYTAPGNAGMEKISTRVNIDSDDIENLLIFAKKERIDLTIVGPEESLALGVVDAFEKEGLKIWGPTKKAAQIETSKAFAKDIMKKYNIPTAAYQVFHDLVSAKTFVAKKGVPIVIKEDGLHAGKGVTVAYTLEEAMHALETVFAKASNKVVIEDYMEGFEFSLMSFVCGEIIIPMEVAQDHKCVYDGDKGPNTGGMGVYSPVKVITPEIIEEAMENVMRPVINALIQEGCPFTGFLYGGFMLTKEGIKTVEFNARFGDPEAEVILPRLESDFVQIILDMMENKKPNLRWKENVTLGVVLASEGYPKRSTMGAVVEGIEDVDALVYHMGTKVQNGDLVTAGGRVLIVVSEAQTLEEAYQKVYKEIKKVRCNKLFYRTDIGKKAI